MEDLQTQHFRDEINDMDLTNTGILGAPSGWIPPGPPDDWIGCQPKNSAPKSEDIDNSGHWSDYSFEPKFVK